MKLPSIADRYGTHYIAGLHVKYISTVKRVQHPIHDTKPHWIFVVEFIDGTDKTFYFDHSEQDANYACQLLVNQLRI